MAELSSMRALCFSTFTTPNCLLCSNNGKTERNIAHIKACYVNLAVVVGMQHSSLSLKLKSTGNTANTSMIL